MPTPRQLREKLLDICRLAAQNRYVAAYEGNISARLPDGRILITPARVNKGLLTDDDLVITDPQGKRLEGARPPSSEVLVHCAVYAARADAAAVVHAHPPYATAFAVAGRELDAACMPETLIEFGRVPLVPYGTPGTPELAEALRPFLGDADALLLARHGVLTLGPDLDSAYFRLEMLEHAAEILHHSAGLGGAGRLDPDARSKLAAPGGDTRRGQPGD